MKQKVRTFVAVEISEEIRRAALDLVDQFRAAEVDVKWVELENMHLTLKFLGDVDSREIHNVCRTVGESVADIEPFGLQIRGAGAFPNRKRPRTLWLGAGEGSDAATQLAQRLESGLKKLGFRPEARRFHPHLTIGRVRRGGPGLAELGLLVEQHAEDEIGRTAVTEVVTFSSTLDRSGPIYEVLGRARLRAE